MGFSTRLVAVCAAASLTAMSATAAWADDLDNDLDLGIDATHESMTLEYDDVHGIAGPSGPTSVTLIANSEDAFNGPACNLVGNSGGVTLALTAHYDATVVSVALGNGGVIESCGVPLAVTVTPVHSGSTAVTFTGQISNSNNAAQNDFTYDGATFDVIVNNVDLSNGGGGGTVCDADPAAPAWAAAILKANGVKPNSGAFKNYISQVAGDMTQGAFFNGQPKNKHPEYETAVLTYLKSATGNANLVMGSRPGWECATVPGSTS